MKETLEVGDKIKITNSFGGVYYVEIERVTKTKAISKPYNKAGARSEFKRDCKYRISPKSPVKWDMTDYSLVNEEK